SAEPAVETSWASHSRVKSRLRKTANMDGAGATAAVIVPPGRTGFGGGGASRSLTVHARNRYALAKQQKPLPVEPVLDRAPAVAAVAAEGAVGRDDPVTRDQEADRVAPHRAADGASRPGHPDASGDLAVARGPAPGDLADGGQ